MSTQNNANAAAIEDTRSAAEKSAPDTTEQVITALMSTLQISRDDAETMVHKMKRAAINAEREERNAEAEAKNANAREQAAAQMESIAFMVKILEIATGEQENEPEYEVISHGIHTPSTFPGQGTAHTEYDNVTTGTGDSEREALENALELMAQGDDVEYLTEAIEADELEDMDETEDANPEGIEDEAPAYHVSVLYNYVPQKDEDEAREDIQNDALSVQVRDSTWHDIGDTEYSPDEFEILLCTGGPACRIVGELDSNNEPSRARLEYQDWYTPWTEYHEADNDALLSYCRVFYWGN